MPPRPRKEFMAPRSKPGPTTLRQIRVEIDTWDAYVAVTEPGERSFVIGQLLKAYILLEEALGHLARVIVFAGAFRIVPDEGDD